MAWKEPAERHSDVLIDAIDRAARHIALTLQKGFAHMADAQTQALADLTAAISALADSVSAEITALQAAVSAAAASLQPDDSAAIEAQVTKLNDLNAALKASVATPAATPSQASAATPAA